MVAARTTPDGRVPPDGPRWHLAGNGDGLNARARKIRLLLTDCDGVLTDGGVYYSGRGEELKRFHIRDGMGVERLRSLVGVEVGIVTGEETAMVRRRAEKLGIREIHLGIKNKAFLLEEILRRHSLRAEQVAYIGDDVNDVGLMQLVSLPACPADAMPFAREVASYVCEAKGGQGAFREVAELIIAAKAQYDRQTLRRVYELEQP